MASLAEIVFVPQGPNKPALRMCPHLHETGLSTICQNCRLRACEPCSETWVSCNHCRGHICTTCEPHAKQRWLPREKKHEYLCRQCAPVQAKALRDLCRDVESAINSSGVWLSDVVAEIEEALRLAKEAL